MNIPIFTQKQCDLPTSPEPLKRKENEKGKKVEIATLDCCSDDTLDQTALKTSPPASPDAISQLDCCSPDTLMDAAPNMTPSEDAEGISSLDCCTTSPPLPTPSTTSSPASPFTRAQSTKICRTAALNIVSSFHTLPYPSPLVSTSIYPYPRAMPVFACCAMQCSYALLMLCHKATVNPRRADDDIVMLGMRSI